MRSDGNIPLSKNAMIALQRRYLIRDDQGQVAETPAELFARVASFIAQADANYGAQALEIEKTASDFYDLMANLEFLPNSPTLMNAGRTLGQLSACFVLPVGDSMEEIFEANKHAALIHKSGGGTGFSFSRLRPRGANVATTSGVASGPVSFMKVINASTEAVKQGGTRRGANMGVLRIDHPDILEFIGCKSNGDELTNFNISIGVTDEFMDALARGTDYTLIDPRTDDTYQRDGKAVRLSASRTFDLIVENAWATGEPGVVFLDRMNRSNPTFPAETIEATNPCGEQPLPPYDSCNLGSINLGKFVPDVLPPDHEISKAKDAIDWDRLGRTVRIATHFLDNVIDQNKYPLAEIEEQTKRNRRIGLGVMGWADMLVKLRLPYKSELAVALAEEVMVFIRGEARNQSSELAKRRGKFPNWEISSLAREAVAMRNATVTTIAPTGTISIIASCSSGIEPYYAIAFERRILDGTVMAEVNPLFEAAARAGRFYSEDLMRRVAAVRSISDLDEAPQTVKDVFLTAVDIASEDHVRMQAAFQKHCDSSVSKTINFPESATQDDVRKSYLLAWELDCKGITIYRDHSRKDQVLFSASAQVDSEGTATPVRQRPRSLPGITEKVKTGYGNLYVTVNTLNGRPFEVFAQIGRSGYTTMADTEAICRLISLALRSGTPVEQIIRQLRGIGGSSQVYSDGRKVSSIPDGIAQVLNKHFSAAADSPSLSDEREICPDCHQPMVFQSGCFCCNFCGYSTC